ncbi:Kinesin-like protein [Sergentomyia squamirostris]
MDTDNCAVRIAVRERPFNTFELESGQGESAVEVHPSNEKIIIVDDKPFVFDHVFGPGSSQETVYGELVAPLIDKMLQGFHCTVLAYGQSGNGKTFTMGLHKNLQTYDKCGLITRSISAICSRVKESCERMEEKENLPELSVSFIEIYNEKVFDLLAKNFEEPVNHKMYKYQGCNKVKITSSEEAFGVLKEGNKNRHVRPTKMNANSSRSHAIFTIYISVRKSKTSTINSAFNFVDLAGSEGIRRTEHKGLALAEGVNINQGLLSMGRILQAISAGDKLIPYRDSVLTTVLQDSLNKNCFLTLLACISPSKMDSSETLNTLRFANSAKSMKNNPQINLMITEIQNARRNTPTKPPVTPRKRQTIAALKETTAKKNNCKTPYNNRTFTTSGLKRKKSSLFKLPPLLPQFTENTPFARKTRRSSLDSHTSRLSTMSTRPDPAPEPLQPIRNRLLDVEPSLTSAAFSPIIRRHVERLEERLGEKMQNILNSTRAPSEAPPSEMPRELVASTPIPHWQEYSCPLDDIKRELQKIVRSEISAILGKSPSRPPSAADNPEVSAVDDEEQNVTFDVIIPDLPTTEFPVNQAMFQEQIVEAQVSSSVQMEKKPSRKRPVEDLDKSMLRRSIRILERSNSIMDLQEDFKKPEAPKKPKKGKNINEYFLKDILKATEHMKGKKKAKTAHKETILKIVNTGNLKQLQLLSQIGPKTAFHIITHRTLNGKFKSLNEMSKLPIWRGKTWNRFLQMNNLE